MKIVGNRQWLKLYLLSLVILLGAGCTAPTASDDSPAEDQGTQAKMLALPDLAPVSLNGQQLHVVATTSIIGDVVSQVGADAVDLTVLMGPGQDPHSFQPGAQTLTAVADAHVIFVNGWDLEEALLNDLESIAGDTPLVPVSANIEPLLLGAERHGASESAAHEHSGADPHTWQSIDNVRQWVANIQQTLSALDPAQSHVYEQNSAAYLAELDALETVVRDQLASIPAEKRVLITNHDALAYFAQAYNFEILDTVVPGVSTLAEASASDIASLVEVMTAHNVCTIFTENTTSAVFAQAVAAELKSCDGVRVVPLYSDALGVEGSGADSYIGMFRANVDAIVNGLAP